MADSRNPGAWTLQPMRRDDGTIDLRLSIATEGELMIVALHLTREEARAHARGVLAAAGDALERTFGGEGER